MKKSEQTAWALTYTKAAKLVARELIFDDLQWNLSRPETEKPVERKATIACYRSAIKVLDSTGDITSPKCLAGMLQAAGSIIDNVNDIEPGLCSFGVPAALHKAAELLNACPPSKTSKRSKADRIK
jgi:hypothetical protein